MHTNLGVELDLGVLGRGVRWEGQEEMVEGHLGMRQHWDIVVYTRSWSLYVEGNGHKYII